MSTTYEYINEMFLAEAFTATPKSIKDAVDNKRVINIYYQGGEEDSPGWRTIEPACFGEDMKGRQAIRAYQSADGNNTGSPDTKYKVGPQKTTTTNNAWKFFLVERIRNWNLSSNSNFAERPKFNRQGDFHMSKVFAISDFTDVPTVPAPKKLDAFIGDEKYYTVDLAKKKALKAFYKPEAAVDAADALNKGVKPTLIRGVVALSGKELKKRGIKIPDIQKSTNVANRLKSLKEIYDSIN